MDDSETDSFSSKVIECYYFYKPIKFPRLGVWVYEEAKKEQNYYTIKHVIQGNEDEVYGADNLTIKDHQYQFTNQKRGLAVIIINEKDNRGNVRIGSEIDKKNFEKIFSRFGFEIRILHNEGKAQLLEGLTDVSRMDHSDCDCFVLAVSSHGDTSKYNRVIEDVIFTIDDPVKTRDIVGLFTDKACPTLAGKPRLFFIQACRGHKSDDGLDIDSVKNYDVPDAIPVNNDCADAIPVNVLYHHAVKSKLPSTQLHTIKLQATMNNTSMSRFTNETRGGRQVIQGHGASLEPVIVPAPCYEDFLVMYATPPGYFAFRRPNEGSWFVKCLAEVLNKSDGSRTLMQELTRVTGKVAYNYISNSSDPRFNNKKQMPVIYSMLCKDVYLVPKRLSTSHNVWGSCQVHTIKNTK